MTENEFIRLSWLLLKAKVLYYLYPCNLQNIPDHEYDRMEKEYLKGCKELNQPNTIESMVGVDKERPSVKLVIDKILGRHYV